MVDGIPLSRRIARAVRAADLDALPRAVVAKVGLGLLDLLACAFTAGALPLGRQVTALAGQGSGATPVIGTSLRASPAEAAFANATLGHALVREDMHAAAVSHLGVVVHPVLLALSAGRRVSGRDYILAAVCGYEVGAAIGRALVDADLVRHFRPTGITGPLAGAAAGSRLLGLGEDAMVSALGLAANTTAGLNEWAASGADDMFFHPGFAARNAVTAVGLAALGAEGSETALDGPAGLFAGLDRADRAALVAPFQGEPEILAVYFKPVPACNYAQAACQAALALAVEERLDPDAVAGIVIEAPAAAVAYPGCDATGPFARRLQAKMSIPFSVATVLARGRLQEENYRDLADPSILRLIAATRLAAEAGFTAASPARQGAAVTVTLKVGRMLTRRLDDVVPASPAEIRARFRAAADPVLGAAQAQALEAAVGALERLDDMAAVSRLLCPARAQGHAGGRDFP